MDSNLIYVPVFIAVIKLMIVEIIVVIEFFFFSLDF